MMTEMIRYTFYLIL